MEWNLPDRPLERGTVRAYAWAAKHPFGGVEPGEQAGALRRGETRRDRLAAWLEKELDIGEGSSGGKVRPPLASRVRYGIWFADSRRTAECHLIGACVRAYGGRTGRLPHLLLAGAAGSPLAEECRRLEAERQCEVGFLAAAALAAAAGGGKFAGKKALAGALRPNTCLLVVPAGLGAEGWPAPLAELCRAATARRVPVYAPASSALAACVLGGLPFRPASLGLAAFAADLGPCGAPPFAVLAVRKDFAAGYGLAAYPGGIRDGAALAAARVALDGAARRQKEYRRTLARDAEAFAGAFTRRVAMSHRLSGRVLVVGLDEDSFSRPAPARPDVAAEGFSPGRGTDPGRADEAEPEPAPGGGLSAKRAAVVLFVGVAPLDLHVSAEQKNAEGSRRRQPHERWVRGHPGACVAVLMRSKKSRDRVLPAKRAASAPAPGPASSCDLLAEPEGSVPGFEAEAAPGLQRMRQLAGAYEIFAPSRRPEAALDPGDWQFVLPEVRHRVRRAVGCFLPPAAGEQQKEEAAAASEAEARAAGEMLADELLGEPP